MKLATNKLEYTSDQIYDRLLSDIKQCEFSQNEEKGLLFFLGFSLFRLMQKLGGGDRCYDIMNSSLKCDVLNSEFISDDKIRSSLYTTAKIIRNHWSEMDTPLESHINVGKGRVFEETIVQELYEKFVVKNISPKETNALYSDLLQIIGDEVENSGITDPKEIINSGFKLYYFAYIDDPNSVTFVTDCLNTMMPPVYKAIMYIPILGNINPIALRYNTLFSQIFRQSEETFIDDDIILPIHKWHQNVFYGNSDSWNEDWEFDSKKHFDTMVSIAYHGSLFSKQINDDLKEKIKASPRVYTTDLEGSKINLEDYANGMCNLLHHSTEYDLKRKNWNSRGEYLQLMGMLFIYSCLYSIFPTSIES